MHSVLTTGSKAKSMFNAYTNVSQRTCIRYVNNKIENCTCACVDPSLINTSDTYNNTYIISNYFLWIPRIAVSLYTFFPSTLHIENTIPLIDTIHQVPRKRFKFPCGNRESCSGCYSRSFRVQRKDDTVIRFSSAAGKVASQFTTRKRTRLRLLNA